MLQLDSLTRRQWRAVHERLDQLAHRGFLQVVLRLP